MTQRTENKTTTRGGVNYLKYCLEHCDHSTICKFCTYKTSQGEIDRIAGIEHITATLQNLEQMSCDDCSKFHAAVHALNGYNVQGVHCFDCRVDGNIYRISGGSGGFIVRLWEVL